MGFMTVKLYADQNLKDNVKYRKGGLSNSTLIATIESVSNGNLSNKNIYDDNSVEISIPISTCALANYVCLVIENTVIAGEITGINYINDTNTEIVYVIDYYTTAQMTQSVRNGFFTSAFGLCRRTNLTYPKESVVNQQSEPYGGSEIKIIDTKLTALFNDTVSEYTGVNISGGTSIFDMSYRLILWISAFAVDCIEKNGVSLTKWQLNPNLNVIDSKSPEEKVVEVEKFGGDINTNVVWQQSFSTGFPVKFDNTQDLTKFINIMLSNVGEKIEIDPFGFEKDNVMKRYANMETQFFFVTQEFTKEMGEKMATVPITQVKMITNSDIFRIQILPNKFADDSPSHYTPYLIDTGYGLNNFNPLKDERDTILPDGTVVQDFSKSKLMTYPYWYHDMVTRIGNRVTLLPQNNMKITNYLNETMYNIKLRFVGGNMPKLLICIQNKDDWSEDGFSTKNESVWYTIYEYPTISWANNVSSQQQIGELEARIQRIGQIQKAVIGASTKGTGFMFGFRGGKTNTSQGFFRRFMTNVGASINARTSNDGREGDGGLQIKRSEQSELDSLTAMDNAGRIVANDPMAIMGEGSIEMLFSQPITIYRCGFTDGELYGFARFIERKGQACHININPITNSGDVFSGRATITSYARKTYYEFFDLDVNGTMPIQYKNAIQMMFCGGCYLIT